MSRSRWARAAAVSVAVLLSGCSTVWNMHSRQGPPAPAVTEKPPGPAAHTVASLLTAGERYKALSPEARQRELARVKARYRRDRSADNLMRLALLTALSDSYRPDGADVRARLKAYVDQGEGRHGPWGPLAGLLLHVLDERARLVQEKQTLRRQLNRHEADVRRLNEKLDRHEADEQRLSDKLDQLKAIEQKLNERSKREVMKLPP